MLSERHAWPGAPLDSGAVACDAGNVGDLGRRCSLSMQVQGGLAGTLNGEQGCGEGSGKGGAESWTTPSGACTLTVTTVDIECQSVFQKLMRVVHGTGTCSQPAAPDSGTSAGPVMIGDFEFVHWL